MIGAERTLSGSKYPEESPKALKPKHSRHKQLSVDLENAFLNKVSTCLLLAESYHDSEILASDWLRVLMSPRYWPLIG